MIWRWRWKHIPLSAQIQSSALHLSFAATTPRKKCKTALTQPTVLSTLLNCHSDLISLTFFLWCARQKDYFHDRAAFDHMVDLVARLNIRFGSVKQVLHQLKLIGFATKPHMILLLLRICWHGGSNYLVFETFEEMLNLGYTPNTYARNILMDALFKSGLATVALRVLKETQVPNYLTYSIAISNLCRLGDAVNVRDVLRTMLGRGYYLNEDTFPVVLNCFCKRGCGGVRQALELYGLMTTLGVPISVYTWSILIHGFCQLSQLVTASYLLEKMVEAGCPPNVVTFTCLIKGFMESQMPGHAFDIFKAMGSTPDLLLCNVLIDCLAKMGKYDDALDLFVSLPERKLVPDSYTFCCMISVVCLSGQFGLLPKLISGLPVQADLVACNSILSYLCKAGSPSGAVEFYNDMVDRGLLADKYTYCGLLRGLCGAGRSGDAVHVYRGILMNMNMNHNHVAVDAHIHTVIMGGLIKCGNLDRSVKLLREAVLNKYPLDVVSYMAVVSGLVRAKRCKEAYGFYRQMKENGIPPNAKTYNVLISGFCGERDVEKVQEILDDMIDAGMDLHSGAFNRIKHLLSLPVKKEEV